MTSPISFGSNVANNTRVGNSGTSGQPASQTTNSAPIVSGPNLKIDTLSKEDLNAILAKYPNFNELPTSEQQTIINTYLHEKTTGANSTEIKEEQITDTQNQVLQELVKNVFIVGVKDKNNNPIQGFEPHSIDEWNALTIEQKQEFINKVKNLIQKDTKFASSIEKIKTEIEKTEDPERTAETLDQLSLLNIKAATFAGITYQEFLTLSESDKIAKIEKYLSSVDKNQLSDFEKTYIDTKNRFKEATREYISKTFGIEIPENIDAGQLNEYLNNFNITYDEVIYKMLKAKSDKGEKLSPEEENFLKRLTAKIGTETGADLLKEEKAYNLQNLQTKFNNLQAKINKGETLTPEEQEQYNILQKTLNSEEAAELQKIELPQPQNEYQQNIFQDVDEFENTFGHLQDSKIKIAAAREWIEQKTANMTPEKKQEYIAYFMTYATRYGYSTDLLALYNSKGFDFSNRKDLIRQSAMIIDQYTSEQRNNVSQLAIGLSESTDLNDQQLSVMVINTGAKVLESVSGAENDKTNWVNTGITVAENTKDSSVLISSTSLNMTIKDADLQLQNRNNIAASDVYNNDVARFELDNLNRYHAQNRLPILDNVTEGNAEMTAYAAENGAVTKLAVKDQVEGFNLLNDRVNEFIDQGVLTTDSLKNLADQISSCDRTNQLAMHEKIMDSKYTEVQEHAASNINKYDASVRADALAVVMEKGNQKAIENALKALQNSPQCVKQEVSAEIIAKANEKAFKAAFASGNLTDAEVSTLTPSEKRQYYSNLFAKATPAQKLEMLKNVPNGPQKQMVYTYIALYDGGLLTSMIKSDMGEELLSVCKDMGAQNRIAAEMRRLGASDSEIKKSLEGYAETYGRDSLLKEPVSTTNPITLSNEEEVPKFNVEIKKRFYAKA